AAAGRATSMNGACVDRTRVIDVDPSVLGDHDVRGNAQCLCLRDVSAGKMRRLEAGARMGVIQTLQCATDGDLSGEVDAPLLKCRHRRCREVSALASEQDAAVLITRRYGKSDCECGNGCAVQCRK